MKNLYKSSNICEVIGRDLKEGMLNHAYMLISNDNEYVKSIAKYVAIHILCDKNTFCGECSQCVKVEKDEHADVAIFPTSKKNIVVDDVEKIVGESYVLPLEGERKVYILNNFDMATVQAQNKLLKTLEEPPKSVVFIITTTNENNVLDTIKSRCKKIITQQINSVDLKAYLSSLHNSGDIERIVDLSDGNLTTAIRFLTNEKMIRLKDVCVDIINNLNRSDRILYYSTIIQECADNVEDFLNLLLESFREVSVDIVSNNTLRYRIEKYSLATVMEISKIIQNASMKLKANCNINAVLDYLLMGILEVRYKCKK